ncbi:MAG: hypothetical protein HQ567_24155 [Candidatus Nealsonbacteria bacterium]|nr:hypothetical protein [Candidatus Nealsonbacteria bacterium]
MALRLGDLVLGGELFNTQKHSVHGYLQLRGSDHTMMIQLVGNCAPDLAGWHIRFEAPNAQDPSEDDTPGDSSPDDSQSNFDFSKIAWQQIGPTGTMTAERKVRVADCSVEELHIRCELDEPPPMQWKRCLYLEWFSQNGRVVVELVDPIIEFVEFSALEGVETDDPAGKATPDAEDTDDPIDQHEPPAGTGLGITSIHIDDEGDVEIHEEFHSAEDCDGQGPVADEDPDDEDPYQLIPDSLQQQFEIDAERTDRAFSDSLPEPTFCDESAGFDDEDEDTARLMRETELLDNLIENSPGVPLDEIFDGPLKLPRPEQLNNDRDAEGPLRMLLGQLALFGISIDLCEHFSLSDTYRLLLEEVCPGERAYPEMRNTQWVQFYSTSDYCPKCKAQFQREYEENERRRKENPDAEKPGGGHDDVPF